MRLTELTAIGPIDGRYRDKVSSLSLYFSEFAFMRYRILIEVEYFLSLCKEIPKLNIILDNKVTIDSLRDIYRHFSEKDALSIKEIEKETNHDIKSIEYFLKNKFDKIGLSEYKEFIHFGLTSQDINNTSIPLLLKNWFEFEYLPEIDSLISVINKAGLDWIDIPMLSHTHGQPASPTKVGKEFMVFVERLSNQVSDIKNQKFRAKFGGSTGNFNAHQISYPQNNWKDFSDTFVSELGLIRQQYTTQIEHYDSMASLFDNLKRINTILIDFCRDLWQYISMDYFKQKLSGREVGSSAMPHKINPIDFENAEGNLGMSNSILSHMSEKLPISRMQRDLSDSTVLRNIGVPISHIHISISSIKRGMSKLIINEKSIHDDLEKNWMIVSEGIQTILRREGYPLPYESLKDLTRTNSFVTKEIIHKFIDNLDISNLIKLELKKITPHNYIGIL